jgi:hypothetical protein
MISEAIPLGFDISRLQKFFLESILPLPPAVRSEAASGWSVLSATGSYLDGWQMDFLPYNGPLNRNPEWLPTTHEEQNVVSMQDCSRPTEICRDYMAEIIQRIEDLGFYPRRARIIRLPSGRSGNWHQDGSKSHYQVRLHIPILTNSRCFFETEEGEVHMPADGNGHFVHINRRHRVRNEGDQDRFHLVMNVWDTRHLSQHHRYDFDSASTTSHRGPESLL